MATETRYFRSTVQQKGNRDPRLFNTLIQFSLRKVTRSCWAEAPTAIINGPVNLIGFGLRSVRLSEMKRFSERRRYTQKMAATLSSMRVPEEEHAAIIEKIFQVVEVAVVPDIPIYVCVWDVTIRFLDSATSLGPGELARYLWPRAIYDEGEDEDGRLMNVDRDLMHTYEPKLIPATKSCIDGLEKVRFDSLETGTRQMPCAICRERLDHFAVEQGSTDHQLMIARLPCLHLYHGDCIVQWLESSHLCPLCRYQMPTVEVEVEVEPSEPSRPLHWNMLMMSAGGVLTTAACFALQMIEAKLKMKISDRLLYVVPLVAIFSSKLL